MNYLIIYFNDWNIILYDKLYIGPFDLVMKYKYFINFMYLICYNIIMHYLLYKINHESTIYNLYCLK